MYEDGHSDGMWAVWLIAILCIAAVGLLLFLPSPTPDHVPMCNTGKCCVGCVASNESPFDPTGCIGKKTATIFVVNDFMTNHIVDSDGCEFDWNSGFIWKYDEYNGHNVTFMYDQCHLVRGRPSIMNVMQDHTILECGCRCGTCQKN